MANFDDLQLKKKKKIDWESVNIWNAIFDSFESGMFVIITGVATFIGLIMLITKYPFVGFIVGCIFVLIWAIVAVKQFIKNVKSQNKYKYDQ